MCPAEDLIPLLRWLAEALPLQLLCLTVPSPHPHPHWTSTVPRRHHVRWPPAWSTVSHTLLGPSHPSGLSLNIALGDGLTTQSKVSPSLLSLRQLFFPHIPLSTLFAHFFIASVLQPVNDVRTGIKSTDCCSDCLPASPAAMLTSRVTLGKSFPLSVPQGGNNSTYPIEVLFRFNELIYIKHLGQCLAYVRCSVNIRYHYYFYIQCLKWCETQ